MPTSSAPSPRKETPKGTKKPEKKPERKRLKGNEREARGRRQAQASPAAAGGRRGAHETSLQDDSRGC